MHPNFCLLTKNDFDRLLAVLGRTEGVTVSETSEFLVQTGCPRAKLEEWLAAQWRQHDVEAVLAGKKSAGPEPHVLFDKVENQIAVRVFTPTEQLLIENARHAREEGFDRVCQRIKETPGATNLVISEIHALAVACGGRNLTIPEVAILWDAFEIIIISLLRESCFTHNEGLRLTEAVNALSMALAERDTVSPQARYAEAKVEARRLLEVDHDPALDAFPELLAIVKKHCSASSAEYLTNDIQLDPDQFLEMLSMLAQDQADPTAVLNPQARIRSALNRARERREKRNRRRWMPATTEQTNALEDLTDVESSVITQVDWEHGSRDVGLHVDQIRLIEAKMEGFNVQAEDTSESLGWQPSRLEAVRRSLAPDRRAGKALRIRFSAYKTGSG